MCAQAHLRWSKHAVLLEMRLLVYWELSVSASPPPSPVFSVSQHQPLSSLGRWGMSKEKIGKRNS